MREIKFRAFWPSRKEMMEPMTFDEVATSGSDPIPSEVIVMQYTGLKDKNGKEIYEGDIVKAPYDSIRVIEWVMTLTRVGFNIARGTKYEVIGNIYENGDLLK